MQLCRCVHADVAGRTARDALTAVGKIAAQARRAAEIIHHIQGFVRKQPLRRTSADINALIMETLSMMGTEARSAKVQVVLELADSLPHLPVDPIQIQQVLLNLIRNGLEAIRQAASSQPRLTIETRHGTDGNVLIAVHDTGVGLPAESKVRLFEPFFTTKENGMGLGLPISLSIVESYGGRLWGEARPSGGSSFYIVIPANEGHSHD